MPVRQIYPSDQFPSMLAGRDLSEGVPLGWLTALQQDSIRIIRARNGPTVTPADEARVQREVDGARVYGSEHLSVRYPDELSALEQAQQDLADATAALLDFRTQHYDENGQLKKTPEALAALHALMFASYVKPRPGSGIEGVQGPAAGPSAP